MFVNLLLNLCKTCYRGKKGNVKVIKSKEEKLLDNATQDLHETYASVKNSSTVKMANIHTSGQDGKGIAFDSLTGIHFSNMIFAYSFLSQVAGIYPCPVLVAVLIPTIPMGLAFRSVSKA